MHQLAKRLGLVKALGHSREAKLLLEKADITLPDAIPHRNVKVDTRIKLVPKRKTFDNLKVTFQNLKIKNWKIRYR